MSTDFFVLCNFGKAGRAWIERNNESADDRDQLVRDIVSGEIAAPVVSVMATNLIEGWCRNVTDEIAMACAQHARDNEMSVTTVVRDFIEHHCGADAADSLSVDDRSLYSRLIAAE